MTDKAIENPNEFEKQVHELYKAEWNGELNYWRFQQTQKISTYLFSFNVGPYKYVEYDGIDGVPPCVLRIYYNEDLDEYVQV